MGCLRTKLAVVAADERDGGRRQVLNLGHTVAHAIEAATGYSRLRHGEAVGIGLLVALRLSGKEALRAEVARAAGRPRAAAGLRWRRHRGRGGAHRARQEARGWAGAVRAASRRRARSRPATTWRRETCAPQSRRSASHEEPRGRDARREPRPARPPRPRALRRDRPPRAGGPGQALRHASWSSSPPSGRPTTRATFCEGLHLAAERADGVLLNPGAWTHYSYAIRDALELSGVPAVEVHLSAIDEREEWRRHSVIRDLCVGSVQGEGARRLPARAWSCSRRSWAGERGPDTARADRLVALMRERELDSLLVTNLVNVRWLTGFTGTNGACVVTADERLFLTDFRYIEQAEEQVNGFERLPAGRDLAGELAQRLTGSAGFEDGHLSVRTHGKLEEQAGRWGGAGAGRRRGREAARGQGRRRAGADRGGRARWPPRCWRRCSRAAWRVAPSARWRWTLEQGAAHGRGGGPVVPGDRGRRRPRRAAARRAPRRGDPGRCAGGHRLGRAARRLLLRLHAHGRHRAARARARRRSTSWFAAPRPTPWPPCAQVPTAARWTRLRAT